jgi:ketosteroid isomerase-like protein
MSQQDVDTLRTAYDAFNRGDVPAVLEVLDPQMEWHEPGGGRAPRGTFRGPQSVGNDVFATVPQNFDEFRAEGEQFIDAGDQVVVTGRFRGRAKNGQELDAPFAHIWTMRNGKAVRMEHYVDQPSWTRGWGG